MSKKSETVDLGFEVGTGEPVSIPIKHMVITGQTQEAGKTTTLEALIARAGAPAVAFITKRGEKSFGNGRRIEPYFRERADWQFVASVLEATMREKMRFERAWIMRASKGASTLADVHENVRTAMVTAKGLSADVYMTLNEYLDIVVPRIAATTFAPSLDLAPGINVLDLSNPDNFPTELQSLVMRSALEWVYERCEHTISIIPEAWEFLPQDRSSPVKLSAVSLIRKGANLRNFVWLDSQDIGGVDKELLRSCPVWLLGVQRETNEIKRVLANIPAGVAKPKPSDVAKLKKGEFYACYGDVVVKTYVQPAWMTTSDAQCIAMGTMRADEARPMPPPRANDGDVFAYVNRPRIKPKGEKPMTDAIEKKLDKLIDVFSNFAKTGVSTQRAVDDDVARHHAPHKPNPSAATVDAVPMTADEDVLYNRFKARLIDEAPVILSVHLTNHEIHIEETRETIEAGGNTPRGRIVRLIASGYFDDAKKPGTARAELVRTGSDPGSNIARDHLDKLVIMGFLTREGDAYVVAPNAKTRIKKA